LWLQGGVCGRLPHSACLPRTPRGARRTDARRPSGEMTSTAGVGPAPDPQALAAASAGLKPDESLLHFCVQLKKLPGQSESLGIDVTYQSFAPWTKNGVFVSKIFADGLDGCGRVAEWNARSEEPFIARPGDYIFQVNEVYGDTFSLIQEMKSHKPLSIHLVRRPTPPHSIPQATPAQASAPVVAASADTLLPQLRDLGDEALAGLVCVLLEQRPWLRPVVLWNGEGEEPPLGEPPSTQAPPPAAKAPAVPETEEAETATAPPQAIGEDNPGEAAVVVQ